MTANRLARFSIFCKLIFDRSGNGLCYNRAS